MIITEQLMEVKTMTTDRQILQAVDRLRGEWPDLLGDQDANTLAAWLDGTSNNDPETIRQTTNRVLELLKQHPQAKARVSSQLGIKGTLESFRAIYQPTAGEPEEIPASELMVCPKDPTHYRKRLHRRGQQLFCPEHGVPLVPADSIKSK
jgi:hypothetical protein